MAGLTSTGFEIKRLETLKTELETLFQDSFEEVLTFEPETVLGQIIGIFSLIDAELWEELDKLHGVLDPDKAEGVNLDWVCALTNITRKPATKTIVPGAILAADGFTLPSGSTARNSLTDDVYELVAATQVSLSNALKLRVSILNNVDSVPYTISIDGTEYIYNNTTGQTDQQILTGIQGVLAGAPVTATLDGDELEIVSTDLATGRIYVLDSDLQLEQLWTPATFSAEEAGNKSVTPGLLTVIDSPVSGWNGVDNLTTATAGSDIETDTALRKRRKETLSNTATATIDAIFSNLINLDDVTKVKVYENFTNSTDANGIPAKSVYAVVKGGTQQEIAETLFNTRAGGINMHGSTTVAYVASNGQNFNINYDIPTDVPIYIDMTLTTDTSFPGNGEALIKAAIESYFSNLDIGQNVSYFEIACAVKSVTGLEITSLTIGKTASPVGTTNITIAIEELASVLAANIGITIP